MDLLPGSYQVVAGTNTASPGEIGNFLIDVLFQDGSSQTFSGAWTYAGGKSPFSFSNPRFTFNVADTSFVTINIRSPQDTELYLLGEGSPKYTKFYAFDANGNRTLGADLDE